LKKEEKPEAEREKERHQGGFKQQESRGKKAKEKK